MQDHTALAGPSRIPYKPRHPFVSADNRPERSDGIFRVLIMSTGSVASVKVPDIVGALSKDPGISVQVVATPPSLHFYSQEMVDAAVQDALSVPALDPATQEPVMSDQSGREMGVKVWKDADEWSDWKKVGDPILHIELRRWADLVIVAPCSADFLAKIAGGLSENLALSVLRALSPTTKVILCPAMNTHMYQHTFTAKHLAIAQDELNYLILGPQGTGKLACGDDGPGKMTDWREIVSIIQDFAATFSQTQYKQPFGTADLAAALTPVSNSTSNGHPGPPASALASGSRDRINGEVQSTSALASPDDFPSTAADFFGAQRGLAITPGGPGQEGQKGQRAAPKLTTDQCQFKGSGGDSKVWQRRWWQGR